MLAKTQAKSSQKIEKLEQSSKLNKHNRLNVGRIALEQLVGANQLQPNCGREGGESKWD